MNYCKIFLLLTISLFISCSDNEEETCLFSDWIGEYSGSTNCNGVTGNVTVTISELADNTLQGTIESDLTTNLEPFSPENCAHKSNISSGSLISVTYKLEGDQITIIEEFESGNCTTTAVK